MAEHIKFKFQAYTHCSQQKALPTIDSLFGNYPKQQNPRASMHRSLVLGISKNEIRRHLVEATAPVNVHKPMTAQAGRAPRAAQCHRTNVAQV